MVVDSDGTCASLPDPAPLSDDEYVDSRLGQVSSAVLGLAQISLEAHLRKLKLEGILRRRGPVVIDCRGDS
ncbi:MAG: hypothetical protein V3V08_23810 [Nannocystaceae bacterium]